MKKTTVLLVCGLIVTTLFSCKKGPNPAPAATASTDNTEYDNNWGPNSGGTVMKVTFVSVTADPYNGSVIVGNGANMYLTKPIATNYTFQRYGVYVNRADGTIYATDTKNIYYNPAAQLDTIRFGPSAPKNNIVEFCKTVNAGITKNGYAVIWVSGANPNAETWKVVL